MTRTITVAGARGGSGASTVAAGIALCAARHARTELVAGERETTAALLGLPSTQDARTAIDVAERLTLTATPTGTAEIAVIDAQRLDQLDTQPDGLLLVALRGPCYLGLRTITTTSAVRADGIVLLGEPGRSLTRRDVSDVCDVPVMAEIVVTANVARTIDAGLLVTRLHQLREFSALRRYLDSLILLHDNEGPARDAAISHAHPSCRKSASTIATDLPVPLSGTGRANDARDHVQRHAGAPMREPASRACASGFDSLLGHVPHAHLAAPVIGVYRCGVAKRSAVTDEERREVCRSALAALASGALDDFTGGSRTLDDKRFPFPADAFTELAADALALAGVTRAAPVSLDDFAERYLPDYRIRGNTAHQKMRAALNLAVAVHAGVVPDYFGIAGWWQVQDLSWYSFLVAVLMVRVAAERTGRPVADVCSELAAVRGVGK